VLKTVTTITTLRPEEVPIAVLVVVSIVVGSVLVVLVGVSD